MNVSTIILLAAVTMAAATFGAPRDCRHACKMDTNGVVVNAKPAQAAPMVMAELKLAGAHTVTR
jgi:hypothetical protein